MLAFLLAACGAATSGSAATEPTDVAVARTSASPSASATPSPASTASPTPTNEPSTAEPIDPRRDGLDVAFGEFAITLEATVIRPGPVTLVVHNAGHLAHGFEMKLERSGGDGGDRRKIETRTFKSGETLRVEADLPPGIYEVECYVADHASRGMRAILEVRADAPLQTPDAGTPPLGTARIVQFAFVPATVQVDAGSTVTWTNDDPAPHTVTADDGTFDSKQLERGADYAVVFDRPGSYSFHCEIHPTMVGVVEVR